MKQTDKSFIANEELDINEDLSEEFETLGVDIDAALFALADECTQNIDFDAVKARVISSTSDRGLRNNAKRSSKRSFIKYLAYAAAAFLMCFGAVAVLDDDDGVKRPDNTHAMSTNAPGSNAAKGTSLPKTDSQHTDKEPEETTEPFMVSAYTQPFSSCIYVGALPSDTSVKNPSSETSLIISRSYIDETLSTYMECNLIKGDNKVYAHDRSSNDEKYYECSIVDESPYNLKLGEMGEFRGSGGSNYVFYWKVTDHSYVRIKLFGFDQQAAKTIVSDLCNEIIDPNTDRAAS